MRTRVRKWGNSLAVRIPKSFADEIGLADGAAVEMRVEPSGLSIQPVPVPSPSLEALLEQITAANLHEAFDYGDLAGKEAW